MKRRIFDLKAGRKYHIEINASPELPFGLIYSFWGITHKRGFFSTIPGAKGYYTRDPGKYRYLVTYFYWETERPFYKFLHTEKQFEEFVTYLSGLTATPVIDESLK